MNFRLCSTAVTTLDTSTSTQLNLTRTRQRSLLSDPACPTWFVVATCSELMISSDQLDAVTRLEELVSQWKLEFVRFWRQLSDPIMIYPNIVNMLGEMSVDINALCLDHTQTYILMIEEREVRFIEFITEFQNQILGRYMSSPEFCNSSV